MSINILSFIGLTHAEVNIQLTEDDYRGNEPDENIGIVVSKDARIASSVSLTVSPVTLSEARRLNSFPMNVELPDNNSGRSPVEASETINTLPQFVTFPILCMIQSLEDYETHTLYGFSMCVYATSLLSICQRKESCIRVFRSFVVTLLHSLL